MKKRKSELDFSALSFRELVMMDTKVGILDSFQALDIQVSKSILKGELADMMTSVFEEKPFYIINHLSEEDQALLSKLIACKQDECVVVPISGQPTGLQKLREMISSLQDTIRSLNQQLTRHEEIDAAKDKRIAELNEKIDKFTLALTSTTERLNVMLDEKYNKKSKSNRHDNNKPAKKSREQ